MVNDPIGDFIIRLKNASAVNLSTVEVPYSALKFAVAEVLKNAGFIADVEKHGKDIQKKLIVTLVKAPNGQARIAGVKRISKPGRRMYVNAKHIHPVKYGKGILVLSTPSGVMTGSEARKLNVGGEALFEMF